MSDRSTELLQAADSQITELAALLGARDEAALSLPCPGREKLGDGTVAACAAHTAENYLRIAAFIAGEDHEDHAPVTHGAGRRGPHRIPSFLRGRTHAGGHDASRHSAPPGAGDVDRRSLLDRLSAARDAFGPLANLTDEQLDSVPAASDMRFCDGQRTPRADRHEPAQPSKPPTRRCQIRLRVRARGGRRFTDAGRRRGCEGREEATGMG